MNNNIEMIVPTLNGEEEDEVVPNTNNNDVSESHSQPHIDSTTSTISIIENIDSIANNNSEPNLDEIISAAISDDTSATSLASTLSDGISRPRSASLHNTTNNNNSSTADSNTNRPSSIPRLRPRSNPRTRTPMRHESPLLVISPPIVVVGAVATTISSAGRVMIEDNHNGQDDNIIATHHQHHDRDGMDTNSQLLQGAMTNSTANERLIRNMFHTRSNSNRRGHNGARRPRAGSIPEEMVVMDVEEEEDDDDGTSMNNGDDDTTANNGTVHRVGSESLTTTASATSTTTTTSTNNTTRTAGRFFTQAVATTSSTRRGRNNRTTTTSSNTQQQHQRTLSTKQNPSHRKIRRWKNDAFIGTPSEHTHTMLIMADGDTEGRRWNEFPYMPNHPLEYNSEFSKLSVDRTRGGERVRERFVRGEVASVDFAMVRKNGGIGSGKEEEEELGEEGRMYQRIVAKCHQLGISPKRIMEDEKEWGKVLYDKLGLRIQSILSRSCSSVDTNATRIVCSFESYLVSLALHSKVVDSNGGGEDGMGMGFPPLQSQALYDVFGDILAIPPRIVIRDKQADNNNNCNNNKRRIGKVPTTKEKVSEVNKCGVLIPTIHFYFPTEGGEDGSSRRSSAFHRILLYAVCQFHGLETSSSVVLPEKKKKLKMENNGRRRRGQQKQKHDVKGASMKVVTVQGGVLFAPSVKLLDFVCT